MNIIFDIQKKDIAEHYNTLWRETGKVGIVDQVINIGAWALIAIVYLFFFAPINNSHIVLFFTVIIASGISEWLRTKKLRSKVVDDETNPALGEHSITIDDEGIIYSNNYSNGKILWGGIRSVDETKNLFRLFVSSFEAMLIPKRFIENEVKFKEFVEKSRNGYQGTDHN